jgi:hypothetical protein
VDYQGAHYHLPLPAGEGAGTGGAATGLGKPLRLISHPVRPDIPVYLAAARLPGELLEGTSLIGDEGYIRDQ